MTDPKMFINRRLVRLSREEILEILQACHWIAAMKGSGVQRELIVNLSQVGAFKKSRTHFSKLEPKMHLQRADQQLDGTWILSFDNGKRKWTHTLSPPIRT
jgi:hypothetical protein